MGVQINGDTGNISATKADYSGNVTIGGTLTYEDVTNIDSVGLITARSGIEIGASPGVGASISVDGNAIFSGITTATTLRAPTGIVTSLIANTARATTGIVTTLTATTGIVTSFVTNTASVGAAVTISESGIEASGIGITCANINGTQIGGRRNLVINGAMQVAQRGTSETGLGAAAGYFTLDRFRTTFSNTAGRVTMAQVLDVHDGFANALKFTCTTADTSIGSNEYFILQQKIEGQDLQQLKKGSSDAEEFTVSFYVKGNASATYALEVFDLDNSRQISKTFSVTTDWTRVVLTFPADTTGAFGDDNAASLQLGIWLHAGSDYTSGTLNSSAFAANTNANRAVGTTSFFDSTDRTFFLTGLQLEVGSQATAFEHRSFGEELSLCQRYYYEHANGSIDGSGSGETSISENCCFYANNALFVSVRAPVTMRSQPSLVISTGSAYYIHFSNGSSNGTFSGTGVAMTGGESRNCLAFRTNEASGTGGHAGIWRTSNASAKIAFSAEL